MVVTLGLWNVSYSYSYSEESLGRGKHDRHHPLEAVAARADRMYSFVKLREYILLHTARDTPHTQPSTPAHPHGRNATRCHALGSTD